MGAAAATRIAGLALALALALVAGAGEARAQASCTGTTPDGGRFAICFDPGNRLVVDATTDGFGGGAWLRHVLRFDDEPDLTWKLEHRLLMVSAGGLSNGFDLAVYGGRYLRHARDGHVVLPFAVGKKIFLPFDVGAEAEAGRFSGHFGDPTVQIGVVSSAALIDLSRSEGFGRRLSIGAAVRWEMEVERDPVRVQEHVVAPFSTGLIDAHAESANGLSLVDLRLEGGREWSSTEGWHTAFRADLLLERVVIAINDRPVSVVVGGQYRRRADELRGQVGVRFALFQRADRRVNLRALAAE